MLIRLENGDWINPEAITAIELNPESPPYLGMPRVPMVKIRFGAQFTAYEFETHEESRDFHERLGSQVVAALEARR